MRFSINILLLATFLAYHCAIAIDCSKDAQTRAPFIDFVACNNYPVESHTIETDDGYELEFFRIQEKNTEITNNGNKPVVLLWHGLLDSADAFVINEEHLAPGFVLANKGFDVWLANSRGNKYSLGHVSLNSSKSVDYWDFSWQDIAEHDIPAAFSYIFNKTNQKINYIGHGQGSTQMFAHLADPKGKHPAVASYLRKFAALGPVVYLSNVRSSPIKSIAGIPKIAELLLNIATRGFLNPTRKTPADDTVCKNFPSFCKIGLTLFDENPKQNNAKRLDYLAGHFPAGTSARDVTHFIQSMKAKGAFEKYDYGSVINMKKYGTRTPPKYDLSLVTEDVGLFTGTEDLVADPADVAQLNKDLKRAKKTIRSYQLGHYSFTIGKELPYIDDLIKFLEI